MPHAYAINVFNIPENRKLPSFVQVIFEKLLAGGLGIRLALLEHLSIGIEGRRFHSVERPAPVRRPGFFSCRQAAPTDRFAAGNR